MSNATIETTKRYELENVGVREDNWKLTEDPDGGWVKFEDMVAIVAKYKKDAERYLWLNQKYDMLLRIGESDADYSKQTVALKCGDVLDKWIDARIAEEK